MAARLPVITTPIGIRGYDVVDGVHAIVADPEDFPAKPRGARRRRGTAALHRRERIRICSGAPRLAAIGRPLPRCHRRADRRRLLPAGWRRRCRVPARSRLLVVTYRFTDPPLGGAETYLLATLKGLHALGDFDIDVATFAVQGIADHLQFSATLRTHRAAPRRVRLRARPSIGSRSIRSDEATVAAHCAALFELWQREDLRQARTFERGLRGLDTAGRLVPSRSGTARAFSDGPDRRPRFSARAA